jgi:uncharacterized protein YfkK (UPF0435 family)
MPSMSYCMFENTSIEMTQCIGNMVEAGTIDDLDLNEYEQDAFRLIYDMCKRYIVEFERLSEEFIDE